MKIGEVMEITGLTKKAIHFYEEQKLINPAINKDNNYREYTGEDVNRLIQISLMRQLDIPIKDIQRIMECPTELKLLLKRHLEKLEENIQRAEKSKKIIHSCLKDMDNEIEPLSGISDKLLLLSKSLEMDIKGREGYIKKQLLKMFPGNFGKMFLLQYAPFLYEPIDTVEKEEAWISIVRFLDDVEGIEYPEFMKSIYENLSEEQWEQVEKVVTMHIHKWINLTNEEFEREKELHIKKIKENLGQFNDLPVQQMTNQNLLKNNEGEFKTKLKELGYYDKFVEKLKILSKDFCQYETRMLAIQNELNPRLDETGRIIVD
ncbi:MAG: MerR family transcriptional regulator [Clostridia bacterium]|nr:MerR family transcriptional regulator [Clostridia bacterium]